jgi:hypothetical protein
MIAVLVVLGLLAGISGARLTRADSLMASEQRLLNRHRLKAVQSRRAHVARISNGHDSSWVWALPDGRLIGTKRGGLHAP